MHFLISPVPLPAGLGHARQFASMGFFAQADPADLKESEVTVLSSAQLAPIVAPNFKLGLPLLFLYKCLFCHRSPPLSCWFVFPLARERRLAGG
jgi:hypothetical protein